MRQIHSLQTLFVPRVRRFLIPFCLFALALFVRCLGFSWGLPDAARWGSYHPDESFHQIVSAVLSVLSGDMNPHFFNYPSLCVYAMSAVYLVMGALGLSTPAVPSPFPWFLVRDILIAGRVFSTLCGAGTAVCVWGMAREVGLRRGAILSGVLLALCPGLVEHSHFATVDVPATFFVSACLWATLRAANNPSQTKPWIWAAILAGLATGTKYNGIIVLVAPLIALFLARRNAENRPAKWLFPAMIGLAMLAFFVSTPYALLAPREFVGHPHSGKGIGFAYELLVHPREGHGDIFKETGLGWVYHLTFNLPFVLTWPLLIAGIAGGFWAWKDRRHWPLLAFALVYFFLIGTSNVRFMRYTFLLVPPLLVWVSLLVSRLKKPHIWAGVLGVFALWGTKDVLVPLASVDPRDRAAAYIKSVGGTPTLINFPWYYTPPFQPQNMNRPVAGVKVVGFDASKVDPKTDTLIVNDYEVREQLRLRPGGKEANFVEDAKGICSLTSNIHLHMFEGAPTFTSDDPLALPGRKFEPHDYLYTHPRVWVYRLR